jgi:hypothetical protein
MSGGRRHYQGHLIEPQRHETRSGGTALAWLLMTAMLALSVLVLTGVIW